MEPDMAGDLKKEIPKAEVQINHESERQALGDTPSSTFTLEILQIIKDVQQQHGLRHGDYQRYRGYCTRRLHRIRKSLHFQLGTGHKHKFVQRKVTKDKLKDVKFLHIPLISCERSWGYAMQLKQEANTEPRKRFHMINRLRRARKHAEELEILCESEVCDARTKLEGQAYSAMMRGNLQFELNKWNKAMDSFSKAKTIYEKLSVTLSEEQKHVYLGKVEEIIPNIRYCAYNIGDKSAMDDLLEMKRTDKIEELLAQAREKQVETLSEVTWRGFTLPVRHEAVRRFLLSVQEEGEELLGEEDESYLTTLERLLVESRDAIQVVRDEIRSDAKSKAQKAEGKASSLQLLESYLKYLKCEVTIKRNLVLVDMTKKNLVSDLIPGEENVLVGGGKTKKTSKPQELIRLYEGIGQLLADIPSLPGLEDDIKLHQHVNAKMKAYRAFKCYYIALAYYENKKYGECIALSDRVLFCCEDSREVYKGVKDVDKYDEKLLDSLVELAKDAESARCSAHATSILSVSSGNDIKHLDKPALDKPNKPLIERLEEYYEDPALITKKPNLITFPPPFQPIPCKPLFFDLALNSIELPSLEHRVEQKKAGGITGFVKGWLWGSKK